MPPKRKHDAGSGGGAAAKKKKTPKKASKKPSAKEGAGQKPTPASLMSACAKILSEVEAHELASPFMAPVDEDMVPGYRDVIDHPMDLSTLRHSLKSYGTSHESFASGMRLIWSNCKQYNDEKSELWKWAHRLEKFFEKLYTDRVLNPAKKMAGSTASLVPAGEPSSAEATAALPAASARVVTLGSDDGLQKQLLGEQEYAAARGEAAGHAQQHVQESLEWLQSSALRIGRRLVGSLGTMNVTAASSHDATHLFPVGYETLVSVHLRSKGGRRSTFSFISTIRAESAAAAAPLVFRIACPDLNDFVVEHSSQIGVWKAAAQKLSQRGLVAQRIATPLFPEDLDADGECARGTAELAQCCDGILQELQAHEFVGPFAAPVTGIPGYADVVSEPIDLGTVAERLGGGHYGSARTLHGRFTRDVRLVWANCKKFNQGGSELWSWADQLQIEFERLRREKLLPLVEQLEARLRARPGQRPGLSTKSAWAKGKQQAKRDLIAPAGARSAFTLFCQANLKKVLSAKPQLNTVQVVKELAALWRKVSSKEKTQWEGRAQTDQQRCASEMKSYKPPRDCAPSSDDEDLEVMDACTLDTFGLDDTRVLALLEGLAGVLKCERYVFLEQREEALHLYQMLEQQQAIRRAQQEAEETNRQLHVVLVEDTELAGAQAPLPMPSTLIAGGAEVVDTLVAVWDFCSCFGDLLGIAPLRLEGLEAMLLDVVDESKLADAGKCHNRAFPMYDEVCMGLMRVLMLEFRDLLLLGEDQFENFVDSRPLNALSWPELARQYLMVLTKSEAGFKGGDLQGFLTISRNPAIQMCAHVYSRICSHPLASPFLGPVDVTVNPNYSKVVTKPMSLRQVGRKLAKGYGDNAGRFASDMRLIFGNCKAYNSPTSELWHWAHLMSLTFEVLWREWVVPVAHGSTDTVTTVSVVPPAPVLGCCNFADNDTPLCDDCTELCNQAAKQFQDEESAREDARLAAAEEHFSSFHHPACFGVALVRTTCSTTQCNTAQSSPVFWGYRDSDDVETDAAVDPMPDLSDAFVGRCLHHHSSELQRTERLMRLLQQDDVEAWTWGDRIALLHLLCDAAARSSKLRERLDAEREANTELFEHEKSSWHGWSKTGAVLLGVDRNMNEFWAFGPDSTQVFLRHKDNSGWAVFDDCSVLLSYLMPCGLRESFLLAELQKRVSVKQTKVASQHFSVAEQSHIAQQFEQGAMAIDSSHAMAAAREALSEHAVHVSGVEYTEAIAKR